MTFHNAWGYFAHEFQLEVVGTFESSAGSSPTPRHLQELGETARQEGLTVIFSEPQLSDDILQSFAYDLNLRVFVLDPEGGIPEITSYEDLMRYNAEILRQALE